MILIGHPLVTSPAFQVAESQEAVEKMAKSSLIAYVKGKNKESLWKFCDENSVKYASKAVSIKDAVLLNALGASYIICEKKQAASLQKLADDYLFDSKILLMVENEKEIEDAAGYRVDGVLFKGVIDGKL